MVPNESGRGSGAAQAIDAIDLSIVVPVYNAAATLPSLYTQLTRVLSIMEISWEIILVDDYSSDGSWAIIEGLCQQEGWVRGVSLVHNYGQHIATLCGLSRARGHFVLTMDDDWDHDPAAIPALWARRDDFDVIFVGSRGQKGEWWKRQGGQLVHFILRYRFGIKDKKFPWGSFRLMAAPVVNHLKRVNWAKFYFNAEVLRAASCPGYITYDGVTRKRGTRYTWKKSWQLASHLIWEYTDWPWRIATYGAAAMIVLSITGMAVSVLSQKIGLALISLAVMESILIALWLNHRPKVGSIFPYIIKKRVGDED